MIGKPVEKYGLHSLRSGDATAAARLAINDRMIKKHGRWKSDIVKDKYIHENLDDI